MLGLCLEGIRDRAAFGNQGEGSLLETDYLGFFCQQSTSNSQTMPAQDIFHDSVKNALIKDGWTITDDPLYLDYGGIDMYVDLGAEKLIAAEKGT